MAPIKNATSLRPIEIGVDIGGTFTDVVCLTADRQLRIVKIPTTKGDPSVAVLKAVRHMEEAWGIKPTDIGRFVHGTTIATNAVLERKVAKIGLITTEGFRDVLEVGRQFRNAMYDVILQPETPGFLAPGALRKEVPERISGTGAVVTPLDEAALKRAIEELVAEKVEGIAVCFLFSFLNPAHERRARELILKQHPNVRVSLSSEVDPAFREYERTVATAFDASIKPVVDRYLTNLESGLAAAGVVAPLQVIQSRGGLAAAAIARERPVRLFLSGPAAGVIGGCMVGRGAGMKNLITLDVGGTSSDIALIRDGRPTIRAEGKIAGYPVRVPMVDVNTIGAGGGSIAWLDPAGGLRVGPHSAGSEPGPACYGRGGKDAAVTDASLVLGYLNPKNFAGGTIALDVERASDVIASTIATPLGLSVEDAALGIHRVVNAQMVEGIRLISVRQGYDPRTFTLVALGGAGPIHAASLARDLGIRQVLIPRSPGVLSATGLLAAAVEHEVAAAFPHRLGDFTVDALKTALAALDRNCRTLMEREALSSDEVRIEYSADMCYVGQSYHLEVPLDLNRPDSLLLLESNFLAAHERVYGHSAKRPMRIVNLRTIHRGPAHETLENGMAVSGKSVPTGRRKIKVDGVDAMLDADLWARPSLAAGSIIRGPAIVEQPDTTTLIGPEWRATVTAEGNLLLTAAGEEGGRGG